MSEVPSASTPTAGPGRDSAEQLATSQALPGVTASRETTISRAASGRTAPDQASSGEPTADQALGAGAAELEACALEGCDVPLPARALDELGRPKGGRRPRYCGKPHADLASRQRRARDLDSVADPLSLAQAAGEAFLPSARQLAAQLAELIARFDQAEAGALGRVQAAEHEAARAAADAVVAREASETAEQGRRQALAQARQDRQARDNAVKEAERARQDGEEIRTAAWEQVVGHERARGQAEAARAGAEAVAEDLVAQNRLAREQLEAARSAGAELSRQVAQGEQALTRSQAETLALSARLETVEQLHAQEAGQLREQAADLAQRLAAAHAEQAATRAELAAELATRQAELTANRPSATRTGGRPLRRTSSPKPQRQPKRRDT